MGLERLGVVSLRRQAAFLRLGGLSLNVTVQWHVGMPICRRAKGSRERTRGWFVMDAGGRVRGEVDKKEKKEEDEKEKESKSGDQLSRGTPFCFRVFYSFLVDCFLFLFLFFFCAVSSLVSLSAQASVLISSSAPFQPQTANSETASIPCKPPFDFTATTATTSTIIHLPRVASPTAVSSMLFFSFLSSFLFPFHPCGAVLKRWVYLSGGSGFDSCQGSLTYGFFLAKIRTPAVDERGGRRPCVAI